jgi:hypothetical protein
MREQVLEAPRLIISSAAMNGEMADMRKLGDVNSRATSLSRNTRLGEPFLKTGRNAIVLCCAVRSYSGGEQRSCGSGSRGRAT